MRSALSPFVSNEILRPDKLRETASWIRDVLDPAIAQDGAGVLQPDDVLTINNLLIALQQYNVPLSTIRFSRIHLAVSEICGKATRWPNKLFEEASHATEWMEEQFGPLKDIKTPLFEKGGRLWGICDQTELSRAALFGRFQKDDVKLVDDSRAYSAGCLGLTAGKWWINAMFAFRDGIIDSNCINGGICSDKRGAYAIVLRDADEADTENPNLFTYRCRDYDAGIFRMTSPHRRATTRVRVLRSHALSSLWAPVAGIRYDGIYKVIGWVWNPVPKDKLPADGLPFDFEVKFERIDAIPIDEVLRIPRANQLDDYKAFKLAIRESRGTEKVQDKD